MSLSGDLSGYLSAEEDPNDETQYLSILNPDTSFENVDETVHSLEKLQQESGAPLIFTVDGSNEIYGVQVAQDENGHMQKYQIQYMQNENGELVPIIETIQLLPPENDLDDLNNMDDAHTLNVLQLAAEQGLAFRPDQMQCNEENVNIIQPNVETGDHKFIYNSTPVKQESNDFLSNIPNNVNTENPIEQEEICMFNDAYNSLEAENSSDNNESTLKGEDQEFVIERLHQENTENSHVHTNDIQIENIYIEEEPQENINAENVHNDDMYQIVQEMHLADVDADQQCQTVLQKTEEHLTKTNILKKSPSKNLKPLSLNDKVIYVETVTEKENIDFGTIQKTCSRSLLKCNQPSQSSQPKSSSASLQVESTEEKVNKRSFRTKEAKQARLFMNFINSTTIIQAPERKERLPRKQKIKPAKHPDEDIVVKEMIVASNGFVEPISEEEKKYLPVTEYVELIDSEDELSSNYDSSDPKNKHRKQNKTVEIEISDSGESGVDEASSEMKSGAVKKKRRSNKNKNDSESESPPKVSRLEDEVEDVTSNLKGIRVDNNSNGASSSRNQTKLPDRITHNAEFRSSGQRSKEQTKASSKTDAAFNVNKSIVFKNPQGAIKKDYKYSCEKCERKFINRILLGRHECPKKKTSVKKNGQRTELVETKKRNTLSSPAIHDRPPKIECEDCRIEFKCRAEWLDHRVQIHNVAPGTELDKSVLAKLSSANPHKGVPMNNDELSRSFQELKRKLRQLK